MSREVGISSFVRRLCQIGDKARLKCWMITTVSVSGEETMKRVKVCLCVGGATQLGPMSICFSVCLPRNSRIKE